MGWDTFYQITNYRISQFVQNFDHGIFKPYFGEIPWLNYVDFWRYGLYGTVVTHNPSQLKVNGNNQIRRSWNERLNKERIDDQLCALNDHRNFSRLSAIVHVYLDVNGHLFRLIIPFDRLLAET